MATSKEVEMNDLTTCAICLDKMRIPKSLPCLHTFCESCISTYIASGFEKGNKLDFECPTCRTTVNISEGKSPEECAISLPLNFLIIGLLETEKVQRVEKQCMVCERMSAKSEATSMCVVCADLLCANCEKHHKANKYSSDHIIRDILDVDIRVVRIFKNMCKDHANKELELYCTDHEIPCCSMCVSIYHRKCDKVLSLEDASKEFATTEMVEKLQKDFDQLETDINAVILDRQRCMASLESQYWDQKKKIESTFDDFISVMKNVERQRQVELLKIHDEAKEVVETTLTIFENRQKIIENERQILKTCMKKASKTQMLIELNNLKPQLGKHRELLQSQAGDILQYDINFKCESDIFGSQKMDKGCRIDVSKKRQCVKFLNIELPLKVYNFNRFNSKTTGWGVYGQNDALYFTVSKDIELCGFLSYGFLDKTSPCKVKASIKDGTNKIIDMTVTIDDKLLQNDIINIDFPNPVIIKSNRKYHIEVTANKEYSLYGRGSNASVNCNNVTFKLEKSGACNTSTSAIFGQIPGFLFRLR